MPPARGRADVLHLSPTGLREAPSLSADWTKSARRTFAHRPAEQHQPRWRPRERGTHHWPRTNVIYLCPRRSVEGPCVGEHDAVASLATNRHELLEVAVKA